MDAKDKLIEDQQAEIERLEALVARYRADRREWKERTFFDRYAAGPTTDLTTADRTGRLKT